jgi:hypothetical protein
MRRFPLTGLIAFTLVGTGCHRAVPNLEPSISRPPGSEIHLASCFCLGQQGGLLLEVRDGQAVRVWDRGGKRAPLTKDNNY